MLFRNLFKLLTTAFTILTFAVLFNVSTIYCHVSKQKGNQSTGVVNVKANKKVLELMKTWNEKIWFFTSKTNPIKSLVGLNKGDIAGYGAEHMNRFFDFLDAAGIKYEERSMNILGTGYPIFSGMENPPRLFITWSAYAKDLKGSIRVKFVVGSDKLMNLQNPVTFQVKKVNLTKQGKDVVVELVPGFNAAGEFTWVQKTKILDPKDGYVLALIEIDFINNSNDSLKYTGAKLIGETFSGEPVSFWELSGDVYFPLYSSVWELEAHEIRHESLFTVVKQGEAGINIRFKDGNPVTVKFPPFSATK